MQRASYQKHNPNMSIHKANKLPQAVLVFKNGLGPIKHALTRSKLRMISLHHPQKTESEILIELLQGKMFTIVTSGNVWNIWLTFK